MGVKGFLISCAKRRATSPQARARCAETISEISSKTTKRVWSGKMAPRATNITERSEVEFDTPSTAPNSKDCCQWSLPSSPPWRKSSNCCAIPDAKFSNPTRLAKLAPARMPPSKCKIRAAPGLAERTKPWGLSTSTPAVKLSKIV